MSGVRFDTGLAVRRAGELGEVADGLRAVAAALPARTGATDWVGPARDAHDQRLLAVAAELRTAARHLDEVATDALLATARARRLATERALARIVVAGP